MRARRGEADLEHVVAADAAMDHEPAAARTMGVDQVVDRAGDASLRQRLNHQSALPGPVGLGPPVLDGAAATNAEMRTEWRYPRRAGALDPQQAAAVWMSRHGGGFDHLAGQRIRHVERLARRAGHAVAEMTDVIDGQALSHGGRR